MFLHHLALVAAVLLLLDAGLRIASRLSPAPLERVVAAAVLAATAAVLEALSLGRVGLGTEPVVLVLITAAAWLLVRSRIRHPAESAWRHLPSLWFEQPTAAKVVLGVLIGIALAWTIWLVRYPIFDWDNLAYHIPEIVSWVHNGRPGSIVAVLPGFPYGNLPVTNEVLLSWGSGISRSFVVIAIWPTLLVALLALSGWVGLRALRVPRRTAALATLGLCTAPMLTSFQANGANSDLPALVWLVACGSLCAAATQPDRERLFVTALLAGALAVGTKTTVAPLVLAAIGLSGYRLRASLPAQRWALLLTGGVAMIVGGTWYLRDALQHGSPLWPYYATPWGDRLPHLYQPDVTFLHRPLATLRRFGEAGYVTDTFLGCLVVLVAAIGAGLFVRRRAVVTGVLLTCATVLLWTIAPDTGAPYPNFPAADAFHGSVRFLMPSVAVATLTVALAARDGGHRIRAVAEIVFAAALALNVAESFGLGFPRVPRLPTIAAGALAGGITVALLGTRRWRLGAQPIVAMVLLVGTSALLVAGADGFVERHARLGPPRAGLIRWVKQNGREQNVIYVAPVQLVMLAQDDLRRNVAALPRTATCQEIAARALRGIVIVVDLPTEALLGPSTTAGCVSRWPPVFADRLDRVYDARSLAGFNVALTRVAPRTPSRSQSATRG